MLSDKQKAVLAFSYTSYDALICDGAVRSGKTSLMIVAYIDWAMREFNNQLFGICGKTVDSATKNIIVPYIGMHYAKKRYKISWRRSEKILEVSRGSVTNYFEVFGGRDESSFALIQGRTLAGVLLDEVVLMPRSFVEQAMARCSVEGAKLWFSCNPGSPAHWFYKEWVIKAKERNALHLHFLMHDNPGLSEKVLAQYENRYSSGVFYQRYILGLWVAAEGLIYQFNAVDHVVAEMPQEITERRGLWYISVDYGTLNPFSAGLWCVMGGKAFRVAEYYYSGRSNSVMKTDEDYYRELEKLAGDLPIQSVIVDPSAASFIATIRRHGRFSVRKAKNDVLPGIRLVATMLKAGVIKISAGCKDAIREFGLYRWDEKGEVDRPIKENDHAMDDIRYFCATILRRSTETKELLGGIIDEED